MLLKAWHQRESGASEWVDTFDRLISSLDGSVQLGARIAWGAFVLASGDSLRAQAAIDLAAELVAFDLKDVEHDLADRARQNRFMRSIASAHATRNIKTAIVEVPRLGTPGGRPLRAGEVVAVPITLWHPSDASIDSATERRRAQLQRIMTEIEAGGAVASIKHLAAALTMSQATIKRDLAALRAAGQPITTRGSTKSA